MSLIIFKFHIKIIVLIFYITLSINNITYIVTSLGDNETTPCLKTIITGYVTTRFRQFNEVNGLTL